MKTAFLSQSLIFVLIAFAPKTHAGPPQFPILDDELQKQEDFYRKKSKQEQREDQTKQEKDINEANQLGDLRDQLSRD